MCMCVCSSCLSPPRPQVRNSWGGRWGDKGYIKVLRKKTEQCGTDFTPEHGSACEGDTDPVTVCGVCGILSESVYPTGIRLA